jgi:hypothetical protein
MCGDHSVRATTGTGTSDHALTRARVSADALVQGAPHKQRRAWLDQALVTRRDGEPPPPFTVLTRSATRDAVALKIELTLCWLLGVHGKIPGDRLLLDADALCGVIGLDPGAAAYRRIDRALRTLRAEGLVALTPAPRGRRVVAPLWGSWRRSPGVDAGEASANRRHLVLLREFWTNGWCAALPGNAIVVLLALLYMRAAVDPEGDGIGLFVTDSVRERRFGFSSDFYYAGRKALVDAGLVSLRWEPIDSEAHGDRRRAVATLRLGALDGSPTG